jgi:hypothetical protein
VGKVAGAEVSVALGTAAEAVVEWAAPAVAVVDVEGAAVAEPTVL